MQQAESIVDQPIIFVDCEEDLSTLIPSINAENNTVSFTQAELKGLLEFLSTVLRTEKCPNLRSDDLWMKAVEQGVTDIPPGVVQKFVIDDLLPNLNDLPGSIISDQEKAQLMQLIKKNDMQRDEKEHADYFKQMAANVKQYGEKRQAREKKRLLRLQACSPVTSPVSSALLPQATTSEDKSAHGGEEIDDVEVIDEDVEDEGRLQRRIKREERINATNFSPSASPPRQRRHKHTDEHKRAIFLFLADQLRKKGVIDWKGTTLWRKAEKERVTELTWQGMRALALKIVPHLNEFSEEVLPLGAKKILEERLHLKELAKKRIAVASRPSEVFRQHVVQRELKKVRREIAIMDGLECTSSLNSSATDSNSPTVLRMKDNIPTADAATETVSPVEPKEPREKPVDAFSSVPFGTPEFDAAIFQGVFTENLMPADQLPQFFRSLEALIHLSTEYNIGLEQLVRLAEQHGNVETVRRMLANQEL
uniref:Uncharacterized protein n=1 Tax=Plectus sambesii TaxID=2011161 RepID=A0A914V5F0_9BILA